MGFRSSSGRCAPSRHLAESHPQVLIIAPIFVLNEVYESPLGVAEHWRLAVETWSDLPAFMDFCARNEVATLHSGTVIQALW